MPSLISLRAELMHGDLRALYLGWLASLRSHGSDHGGGWDEEDADDDRPAPSHPDWRSCRHRCGRWRNSCGSTTS